MALEGKRINELTEVSKVDTSSKLAIDTGGEEALSITLKNLIDSSGIGGVDIATTEKAGIVKPDGTTISVSSDGTISSSASGFSFEGTKAEFNAAVTAGTITDDSVSIITDDVSGDTVATKADLAVVENNSNNLTNITSAGRSTISNVGFPSSRFDTLTLGASGATYTAPANGYFCLKGNSGITANFAISFYNQTANFRQSILGNNYADWVSTYIPAKKGDVVSLLYNNVTAASHSFLFIYAEGNK